MFCDDAAALMDHLGVEKAIVIGHSMGGRIAQLMALEYPNKVDKLILASTGAAFPTSKGLPLKICTEMIEWGYEKYVRDHSILVGFTDEFAKQYPERVEKYLQVRMANLCPVEFYLRHLIARQSHDTTGRLKDIRVPTLILVGEDDRNVTSDINHRSSSEILAKGIPNAKLLVLPGAQLVGVQLMGVDQGQFWSQMRAAVELNDVMEGALKSVVFGVACSLVAV